MEMTPADPNSPLMRAWTAYTQSADYLNTLSWATKPEHTEGSLWAAFERGFAAGSATTTRHDDDGSYLWQRCYACGHRLRFLSDGCPQCGIHFTDGDDPPNWPELCDCQRCVEARAAEPE